MVFPVKCHELQGGAACLSAPFMGKPELVTWSGRRGRWDWGVAGPGVEGYGSVGGRMSNLGGGGLEVLK